MRCCLTCLDLIDNYDSSSSSLDDSVTPLDDSTPIKISFNNEPQPPPSMAIAATKAGESSLEIPFTTSSPRPGTSSSTSTFSGRIDSNNRRPRSKTETATSRKSLHLSPILDNDNDLSGNSDAIADSNEDEIISDDEDEDEEEDEPVMTLFSALHWANNTSIVPNNNGQKNDSLHRSETITRPRSSTNRSIELGKMSGMRIGQRRKSLPTMARRVTISRSHNRLSHTNSNGGLRKESTKYVGGTPSSNIDLNKASVNHANLFLSQLLENYELSNKWVSILMKPLLLCSENIDLDIKGGDSIDIRHYVKIKRIPGGSAKDTHYIDGIVFTKSLALKSMKRQVENPRIMLISFPLEYSRTEQHFMSLDPVIAQEAEYLKNLTKRILILQPQLLITSERVSGIALQMLNQQGVVVVTNVDINVVNRISRYCQSDIISSIDKLAVNPKLGQCGLFEAKTYRQGNIAKTYLFFTGTPKRSGCTILIRGGTMESLSPIKAVVAFMVYVVFNLKLETSLMRDQFVLVPSTELNNSIHQHEQDFGYFHDLIRLQENKVLSSSPFVHYGIPYLLQVARNLEDQLVEMEQKLDIIDNETDCQLSETLAKLVPDIDISLLSEHIEGTRELVKIISKEKLERVRESWENQKKQWESFYTQFPYMFSPSNHQSIVMLHSIISIETRAPCVGPEHLGMEFYGDSDRTLGQYIEEVCAVCDEMCPEECEHPLRNHYRSYVFGDGKINVIVEPFECRLPGLQDTILMWSHCKVCRATMPVLPMSATTWKYSLGKYFELSFLSSKISFRAGLCPHNLYRDHVRYFGFHDLAVRFEYESINLYEIMTPGPRPTWLKSVSLEHKVGLYRSIHDKITQFYGSVLNRLKHVKVEGLDSEKIEESQIRVEELKQRAEKESKECISQLEKIYLQTEVTDITSLNAIVRTLQEHVVRWDLDFTDFEHNFFPSEKDITRITAQQLKKLFLIDEVNETPEKETPLATPNYETGPHVDVKLEKMSEGIEKEQEEHEEEGNVVNISEKKDKSFKDLKDFDYPSSEENHSSKIIMPAASNAKNGIQSEVQDAIKRSKSESDSLEKDSSYFSTVSVDSNNQKDSSVSTRGSVSLNESKKPTTPISNIPVPIVKHPINPKGETIPDLKKIQSKSRIFQRDDSLGTTSFRKKISDRISFPTQSWRQRFGINPKELETQYSKGNKVSTLAKHFDLLSMEFEKERALERDRLAQLRTRAFPISSSKPIVEVYRSARDAVNEALDDEDRNNKSDILAPFLSEVVEHEVNKTKTDNDASKEQIESQQINTKSDKAESLTSETTHTDSTFEGESPVEPKENNSELHQMPEKQSLMQSLASFWAERSATGWKPLEYPLHPSEHIFADSNVIVREDEPSSLIAFCLSTPDYLERIRKSEPPVQSDMNTTDSLPAQSEIERWMLKKTGVHLKYQFEEGSASLSCKIFFAEQFDAFRKQCQFQDEYIQSLSRCIKWDSSGGKSGSAFLKTLDDKLVVKQLSPTELDAFMKFAPSYFEYMAQAFFHDLPTVLAKIFGFYQIQIRNPLTGKTIKMDFIVMENLFYKRKITRVSEIQL